MQFNGPLDFLLVVVLTAIVWVVHLLRRTRSPLQNPDVTVWEMAVAPTDPHAEPDQGTSKTDCQQTMALRRVTSEAGDEFMLLRKIGSGAAGSIFEAAPVKGRDKVAIKVLTHTSWDNEESWNRFIREVDVCRSLHHPAIVKVYGWGVCQLEDGDEPTPFMIMELVVGRTLRSIMDGNKGQFCDWSDVVGWMMRLLDGLKVAHEAGVVHRDIKPANIMVTDEGDIKLMDFGLARQGGAPQLTRTNTHLGTPLYMSPKHFNAKSATAQSDLYSLGVVSYEMLAGVPYPEADVWALVARVMAGDARDLHTVNTSVPVDLSNVVHTLMQPRRERRYATAAAALDELTEVALHYNLMFPQEVQSAD